MNVRLSELACSDITCTTCIKNGLIGKRQIPANKELIWNYRFPWITTTDISCGMRLLQGLDYPRQRLFQSTFFSKFPNILGHKPATNLIGDTRVLGQQRLYYLNYNHQYVMSSHKAGLEAFEKAVKDLDLGVTFRTPYIHNYNYGARDLANPLNLEGTPSFRDYGHSIAVMVWMWNGNTCDPALADIKDWYWNWKDGAEL